jgi:protein-S-isoprenylcysteine O-methyltransferase Ste14
MIDYLIIAFGWLFFYTTHSFLAHDNVKERAARMFGKYYSFYRLSFNLYSLLLFSILGYYLFVRNDEIAFQPTFITQSIGGILFLIGLVILAIAFSSFNKREFIGREQLDAVKPNDENEVKQKQLVKTGLYAYVRHPLYFGIILMLVGALIFLPTYSMMIFVIISLLYLPIGVKLEEQKLVKEFGEQYISYQREVKMLFPFLF